MLDKKTSAGWSGKRSHGLRKLNAQCQLIALNVKKMLTIFGSGLRLPCLWYPKITLNLKYLAYIITKVHWLTVLDHNADMQIWFLAIYSLLAGASISSRTWPGPLPFPLSLPPPPFHSLFTTPLPSPFSLLSPFPSLFPPLPLSFHP